MTESHVGRETLTAYFRELWCLLKPHFEGTFLHEIHLTGRCCFYLKAKLEAQ
jgi:hypothetical protein